MQRCVAPVYCYHSVLLSYMCLSLLQMASADQYPIRIDTRH